MNEIIIYTTPTCPHCKRAKDYLNENNISYAEKDISSDSIAASELRSQKIMSVPTFKINGHYVVGFDLKKINEYLTPFIVTCPECNSRMRLPSHMGKLRATCPHCKHKFETKT
ncbi:MAG: hypothetical protein N4A40_04605 [Tissierellales bacterium]|jgi:glutaredoxin-like YruB-family protein|nr:hypothetical protein [Tissierellales bacterium]